MPSATPRTLRRVMSATEERPDLRRSLDLEYNKRLMLFSGRANPELASRIATKLDVDVGLVTLKTFSSGVVYCS